MPLWILARKDVSSMLDRESDRGPADDPKVKSLLKAIRVISCFTAAVPVRGVTDIATELGLNKSTVHNILDTFEQAGWVDQDRATRRYTLGMQVLALGNVVREGLSLRKAALASMEALVRLFSETVHLAIAQDGRVIYIESLQPPTVSLSRLAAGKAAPLHCTGVGKALLAFMSDDEVRHVVDIHGLPRFTSNTIVERRALAVALEGVRTRGYAIDNMEHEWGIRCIAAPIRDEDGKVVASLSVSAPSERLPLDGIEASASRVVKAAGQVSMRLGYI